MGMSWIWIGSIIATLYIVDQKNLGSKTRYFFLSLFTGPIALMIVLVSPSKKIPGTTQSVEVNTLQDAKKQLQELENSLLIQEIKIKKLGDLIQQLSGEEPVSSVERKEEADAVVKSAIDEVIQVVPASSPAVKKADMELDFARNWLNKIGIAVLALGVAFLISYTFKYFGPFLKIAFGYLVAAALFVVGIKFEVKDKLMKFGRALLGGAWAIVYFTTYAMHHFEASSIISSQGVDLCLLVLVVMGMVIHTLKYQSEDMMSLTLSVAYLTTTIGHSTNFTIFSNMVLAVLILILVYRYQWIKLLSLGIIATYGIHLFCIAPQMIFHSQGSLFGIQDNDLANLVILFMYGSIFFIGAHLIRSIKDEVQERGFATANLANIAIFSVLSYPLILKLFYAHRFSIVLLEGVVYLLAALMMKKLKQQKMYLSDIVAAVFVLTFAVSLKFLPTSSLMLWMIEVPFLLFIGINYKERVFTYLSYALAAFVFCRLFWMSFYEQPANIQLLGHSCTWYGLMCFVGSLSMGICFYLTHYVNRDSTKNDLDQLLDQLFSIAAALCFSLWLFSFVCQPWVAFSLSMQGWLFLLISGVYGLRRFRAYAYLAFGAFACVFLFSPINYFASGFLKWLIVICNILSVFAAYHAVKSIKQVQPKELFYEYEEELAFSMGVIILVTAIHQYVGASWISLSLGLSSVLMILMGFVGSNKTERMGGMVLLALTLGRVVFIDLSGLEIVFKIITLIVLGVLFLGVSYVYNRFNIKKDS